MDLQIILNYGYLYTSKSAMGTKSLSEGMGVKQPGCGFDLPTPF
jgi:hypothetical protein